MFVAIPVGELFGTSFFQYAQWAARGFADPAAYILFLAGLLPSSARRAGPNEKFAPAFFGALLLALAIFMKPIVAPAAAVLLGGAGLAALSQRQWPRLAGLCIGFLPVFSMALHNWVFGHVFVLFSANADEFQSAGDAAVGLCWRPLRELLQPEFRRRICSALGRRLAHWLSGPARILCHHSAECRRRRHPHLCRRCAAALRSLAAPDRRRGAGAACGGAVLRAAIARYHFLTWLLTMLVVVVWLHEVGIGWLQRALLRLCRPHRRPSRCAAACIRPRATAKE